MFASKVFVAFAAAGIASAASSTTNSACSQPTTTITNAADASALGSSCPTYTGNIAVATGVTTLDFGELQVVNGDFSVDQAVFLTSLTANSLTTITGTMLLNGLTTLGSLSMTALKTIGTISWTTLPALESLTFTDVVDQCSSVTISDTRLHSLDGINLATVDTMNINNNLKLSMISTQVGNITQSLEFSSNGQDLNVEFPNLIWAANMTFRNCSTISMPSLAVINNTLGFYENYFENYTAPNLTSIGGQLAFVANPSLSNVTMNSLTKVGGLEIANNSALVKLDGFQGLKVVSGAIDVTGNYTDLELPSLTSVSGAVNLVSSGNFSCTPFDKDNKSVWNGAYNCKAASDNVQPASGSGTSTGSSSSASSTKKSDAGHLNAPVAMGVIGGFLAMLV